MLGFFKNKKSLRLTLIISFLVLSLLPLTSLTVFFYKRYEKTFNTEVEQRINLNKTQLFRELRLYLKRELQLQLELSNNKALKYYLFSENYKKIKEIIKKQKSFKVASHNNLSRQMILNSQLIPVVFFEDQIKKSKKGDKLSLLPLLLSDEVGKLGKLKHKVYLKTIHSVLNIVVLQRINSEANINLGYLLSYTAVTKAWLTFLKKNVLAETILLDTQNAKVISTKALLTSKSESELFRGQYSKKLIDVKYDNTQHSFSVSLFEWQGLKLYWGLGISRERYIKSLEEIRNTIIIASLITIFVLIVLSIVISSSILKPLYRLLESTENLQKEQLITIPDGGFSEIQKITKQFNLMSKEIFNFQNKLKGNYKDIKASSEKLKHAQSQLVHSEKMASLGQLVAGIAHELNNPIGFIHSNVQYLDEYTQSLFKLINTARNNPEKLEEQLEECDFDYLQKDFPKLIKSCKEGAQRTRDIVVGLRSFSRLDEAVLKEVNINSSLDETLNLLVGEIKNRIKIIKSYGSLPLVTCYSSQLNQVFMNLLSNASQAIGDEGEIEITTQALKESVSISIRDTGCGISNKNLENIFDPFFTTKEQGKGTGLGLSISYGIIEKHKGTIRVTSKEKQGTCFTINIPIA